MNVNQPSFFSQKISSYLLLFSLKKLGLKNLSFIFCLTNKVLAMIIVVKINLNDVY